MTRLNALDLDRCDCDHFPDAHHEDGICGYSGSCGCEGFRGSLQRIEDYLNETLDAVQRILEEKRSTTKKRKA